MTSSRSATSTFFSGGTLLRRTETATATRTGGLEVHGVTWTIEAAAEGRRHRGHSKTLLDNISLTARPGTLTAVIGPSGAGKSTFVRLVAGYTHPTTGTVTFEGHNIHAEYASLRYRIGMVPQDDVVHGQLTVRQALMYAAAPGCRRTPRTLIAPRSSHVLEELEPPEHANTRRQAVRRQANASVGMELLTGLSLLILTSPLRPDPALDRWS